MKSRSYLPWNEEEEGKKREVQLLLFGRTQSSRAISIYTLASGESKDLHADVQSGKYSQHEFESMNEKEIKKMKK